MHQRDGLSREDRLKRLLKGRSLSVMDNKIESLLGQAFRIAEFLGYHNLHNQPDGYFSDLLDELENPASFFASTRKSIVSGNVEPSQALLLIFIENLHQVTEKFNERWKMYPEWYLNDVLGVEKLPVKGNKVWISLKKNPFEKVSVKKGARFVTLNKDDKQLYYNLLEDIEIPDTTITKAYHIDFERDSRKIPEKYLSLVTSVKVKELQIQHVVSNDTAKQLKTVGVKITSPALLLREGQRSVSITLYSETDWITSIVDKLQNIRRLSNDSQLEGLSYEGSISEKIFNTMFYLSISTSEGWKNIPNYTVRRDKDNNALVLSFKLDERFPSTEGCTIEKHKFSSKYPKLNVHLNFDAWMYPYSWMKDFIIYKVKVQTEVKDISNIQVYNELGKVDAAKPFQPFGINNLKGTWFAIGNYEMAIKNTKSISINIQWRNLPEDKMGLYGYYHQYHLNIDNNSFTLCPRYLADYEWKEMSDKRKFHLFNTETMNDGIPLYNGQLIFETNLVDINIEKMSQVKLDELEYEYSLKSRSGFVDFILESPEMGFGEAVYRKIFTEQLMQNTRKNQKYPELNPPINPLIERIILSYKSEDTINLYERNDDSAVDLILPVDSMTYFPECTRKPIPLAVSMDDINVLLVLENVIPDKKLSVFFDFVPSQEEVAESDIPLIHWYIGNMRNWKLMSRSDFIQKDETMHLSVAGRIEFLMPETIDTSLYDHEGLLWIRAGISTEDGKKTIPTLQAIYQNAVPLELDINVLDNERVSFKDALHTIKSERDIPGIVSIEQLTPFFGGREFETDKDLLARVSEHITHLGKAVTARDYERIILQVFPDIGKTKCYRDLDNNIGISIVVLPAKISEKPLVSNYLMIKVERFLRRLSSAYVDRIRIINPIYEQVMVRVIMKFDGPYLSEKRKKKLLRDINKVIAPWQIENKLPEFGYSITIESIYQVLFEEFDSKISVKNFEVICFVKGIDGYKLVKYTRESGSTRIYPSKPNSIFIPSAEHIIHIQKSEEDYSSNFGIDEMKLGETFIIN